MNAWKIILATIVIFGAGVVTGGLTVKLHERSRPQPAPVAPVAGPPWAAQRLEFLRRAQEQLRLAPAQRREIEQILQDSRERTRLLWQKVEPQAREELRHVREQIRAALTPEQRARFDEIAKNRAQRPLGEIRRRWLGERRGPLAPETNPAAPPERP